MGAAPERPLVIWDGDCGFCRRSVLHLRALVGDRIAAEPYQTAHTRFPEVPVEAFREAVHLAEPDGRISRGAEAVYRALALGGRRGLLLAAYRRVPGFAAVSEAGYGWVARHRSWVDRLTRLLVGDLVGPPRFGLTRWVFLRCLALVYLTAFVSLGTQVHGLIGEHGLLPAGEYLAAAHRAWGDEAVWRLPTLGWLGAGDGVLAVFWTAGAAAALLALAGVAQGPALLACWGLYLSLVHLGQDFLSFQWDSLLCETGLAALLLAPWSRLRPAWPRDEPPVPWAAVWLLRLVLFKLMFSSGLTKLTWHDPTWCDLSALGYHYWTQPIPTPLAWYANRLPRGIHVVSCALMYVVELGLPFVAFAPRRPRLLAAAGLVGLQAAIAATGNYGFFNLLSVVLCVPLIDDAAWPEAWRRRLRAGPPDRAPEPRPSRGRRAVTLAAAAALAPLSVPPLVSAWNTDYWQRHPDSALLAWSRRASPWLASNGYGLFRTMTTTRPELTIEGTLDGRDWREIVFRYKPGDPERAPRFFAPHMPRLDWQMWFAALRAEQVERVVPSHGAEAVRFYDFWLQRLLLRLLQREPQVQALLGPDPFGGVAPRQLRLVLWQYRFSDGGSAWWVRERVRVIAGPVALPEDRH